MTQTRVSDRSAGRNLAVTFSQEIRDEERRRWPRLQKRYVIIISIVLLICIAVAVVHLCFYLSESPTSSPEATEAPGNKLVPPDPEVPQGPSPSKERHFTKAAVCSDGAPCSVVGRDILRRNGSAIDAAVATMLCNGVVNCQSMGIGGGFLMTYYRRSEGKAYTLIARETAPSKATHDMFKLNPEAAKKGALAIGVPGELMGYWEAHRRFGKMPWAEVVSPAVKICEEGYNMTQHQSDSLNTAHEDIRNDQTLMDIFLDQATGKYRKMGSLIKHKQLCVTLRLIAERGGEDLYTGSLAKMMVQDIQQMGGIITEKDLSSYKAEWAEPVTVNLRNNEKAYTVPPPGSGAILAFILNILDGYNFTAKSIETIDDSILTYHRITEAYKWAFAKRAELGDSTFIDVSNLIANLSSAEYADSIRRKISDNGTRQDAESYEAVAFSKSDHGTAHMSVIAPSGDAVAITSTVNLFFGASVTSKQTGIILNSVMDDFSSPDVKNYNGVPYSPANKIEPGKRPLSSMSPTIIVGPGGDVRMVVGASGGTKISTAVAYVIMRYLWFGDSIKEAVDASRFHHQLFPMAIEYEFGVLDQVVKGLERLGHKMKRYRSRGSVICAVGKKGNDIAANADYRKGGDVDGF